MGEKQVRLKLVVVGGSRNGEEIQVSGPKFFIGRDRECQLRPGSDVISRHHCALIVEDGYVAVRDFNSKNGTFVDGQRVVGEQELQAGCELAVGPLRFLVQFDVAVGGKKRPPVQSVTEAAERTAQLAGDDDADIDDWLDESDPSGSDTGLVSIKDVTQRRTDPSHSGAGSKSNVTDSKILASQSPEAASPNESEESSLSGLHKQPGKLPPQTVEKDKSVDTQAAVRDALRKLREKKQKKS
ncbi:MAG: FHA domain-containing protein [Pirellulales bacterium]|nr:FHA domain-containing protein [Pirellulales bacterium]